MSDRPAVTTEPAALHDPSAVAMQLLARPEVWQHQVSFDEDRRYFRRIADDESWEAWLLTWLPGQTTGIHDHGDSSGAFVVVSGTLVERSWTRDGGADPTHLVLAPRTVRAFDRTLVHEVANIGRVAAISLHVYAPRLTRMGQYVDGSPEPVSEIRLGEDW